MRMCKPIVYEVAVATENKKDPYTHYWSYGSYAEFGKPLSAMYLRIMYDTEKSDMMTEFVRCKSRRINIFQYVGSSLKEFSVRVNCRENYRWDVNTLSKSCHKLQIIPQSTLVRL